MYLLLFIKAKCICVLSKKLCFAESRKSFQKSTEKRESYQF